jgi:hypothetical protein
MPSIPYYATRRPKVPMRFDLGQDIRDMVCAGERLLAESVRLGVVGVRHEFLSRKGLFLHESA